MKHLIDYKGKYFIIKDTIEDDGMFPDYDLGTISDQEITDDFLVRHIASCRYYGIPPYIGKDTRLIERIEELDVE